MTIAFVILIIAGIYLLLLGTACILAPAVAKRFLMGFAGSAFKHYLEMAVRMIVGIAMVLQAPLTSCATAFTVFGWLLIGTTAVLSVIPWTWHHYIAETVLPRVTGSLALIGVVSIAMGSGLMICLIRSAFWGAELL